MIYRQLKHLFLLLTLICAAPALQAQPNILSLNTTDPNPTNDPILNWSVTFDQAVTGVSTANFTTSATGTTGNINSVTASPGTQTWAINVTGISGTGTLGVDLSNPAGISGTTAPLTQTFTGQFYDVDNDSPFVVSITRLDANPTSASTVNFAVVFSEKVYNVTSINFAPGGSLGGNVGAINTADNLTWTVALTGVTGSGTVSLDLNNTANITDAAGNWLLSDFTSGEQYTIDQDGPDLVCITRLDTNPTSATTVQFLVAFNEPAAGVDISNFAVAATGTSTGTVSSVTNSGDGTTWTLTVDNVGGAGQLTVNLVDPSTITDIYGNINTSTGPGCESYDVDREGPEVTSIVMADNNPTSSSVVTFLVTFNENVTTGVLSDFSVFGTASGTVSLIENNANVTSVTISGVSGPGSLCLRVNAPSTITDLMGNGLQNIPVSGPCYIICLDAGPVVPLYPSDGETTVTTADNIAWNGPAPDLNYHVYFDGTFQGDTTATLFPIPGPLTPGQHSYRIEADGSCTSGTEVFFNVLNPVSLVFPADGYQSCQAPRVFTWETVEGATTYTLVIDGTPQGSTTGTQLTVSPLPATGVHTWYVLAENDFGTQQSQVRNFNVTGIDPVTPSLLRTNGTIYSIVTGAAGNLVIGGDFTAVLDKDGSTWIPRSNLAALSSSDLSVLDWSPQVNGAVYTMKRASARLILGGNFTSIGSEPVARVATLASDLSTTTPGVFRPHANGAVRALEVIGDTLVYAGDFTKVGVPLYNFATPGTDAVRVAIADLTTSGVPHSANLDPNASVRDLLYDGSNLYIGGVFSQIGGRPIHGLAQATLPTTESLALVPDFNQDIDLYVYTLEKLGNTLYFGGSFNSVQGQTRHNAAAIDITSPTASALTLWNPDTDSAVNTIRGTRPDSIIYIGGTFTTLHQQRNTYLAGVDPILGYISSCAFNSDRIINHILATPENAVTPTFLYAGGQATITGTSAP